MTELAPGSVTTADLYRELVGLRTDVVKALERLSVVDSVHKDHEARIRNLEARPLPQDNESRLRDLEVFRWKTAGARIVIAAIISAVTGGLSGWIVLLAGHH